jgi:CHAT domain-containing protein
MATAPRALALVLLLQAAGCTTGTSPERVAELRTLEAESAARLTAEGQILFQAEPITLQSYKSVDGATRLLEEGELRRGIREASKALFLGRTAGPALVAMAKRDLAYAYNLAGDLDRAATYATEAVETATSTPADWFRPATRERVLGPSHKLVGDVRLRQGRAKDAIAAYDRALAASEPEFVPFVRASLANAHLAAGSPARARELFRQAEPGAPPSLRALVRRGLGRVLLAEKRYQEAARWFEEAARTGGDDQAYERLWALDGLARARRGEGDRAGTVAAYRHAIDAAEQVRARFRSEEFKTGFFGDVQGVFEDAIRSMMEARQVEAALETSERGRSRALLDLLRGRGRQSAGAQAFADPLGRPLAAAALRAAVPSDTAVVAYHVVADRTYAWTIRRSGVTATTLEIGRAALREQARAFRSAVRDRAGDVERLGAALHGRLLAPLSLRPGEAIVVVPHDVLHYMPFHALRAPGGWVVEERAVSYAPSVSAAAHLLGRAPRPRRHLLALGNPDLGSARMALPAAQREVQSIQALFPGAEAHIGAAATKARLLARAADGEIIHLAAHADVDEIDPLYSTIHLARAERTSGDLEAHEVYRLVLPRAGLVTLSACDTGGGRVSRGDEIWGFTRAFLSAGSSTLLVSLWPVEDEATARTMEAFYREVRTGPARTALRAAQLAVLRERRTAHPFFWAPFVLVGDVR